MINVITDFDSRVKEIDAYFSFIEKLDKKRPKLFYASNKTRKYQNVDQDLMKILKANGFLILYNLVESAVTNSLHAIYEDMRLKSVSFNAIRTTFKKVVLKNIKNSNIDDFLAGLTDLSLEVVYKSYKYDKGVSGNLDARKFRELAQDYGFSDTVHRNARGGNKLLIVKSNRNSLAHGETTFSECGRQYSIEQMIETKKEVILYVKGMLANIRLYLANQDYVGI